jgi:hypothetical protein
MSASQFEDRSIVAWNDPSLWRERCCLLALTVATDYARVISKGVIGHSFDGRPVG